MGSEPVDAPDLSVADALDVARAERASTAPADATTPADATHPMDATAPADATAPTAPLTAGPTSEPHGPKLGAAALALLERTGVGIINLFRRPRVRTVSVGVVLIVFGAFIIGHSAWTFPVVIVGILMVLVAWMGARMEGRIGIEWGDAGAGLDMRVRFKPSGPPLRLPAGSNDVARTAAPGLESPSGAAISPGAATAVSTPTARSTLAGSASTTRTAGLNGQTHPILDTAPRVLDADVIEGDAQTIEIDVDELRALIAAAEQAEGDSPTIRAARVSWQERSDRPT